MAGISLLKGNSIEAVEKYREALQVISKYDNHAFIKIDTLPKIHTLYNLSDILSDKSYPVAPPTLRDDKLKEECNQFENQYLKQYISEVKKLFLLMHL